MKDTDQSEESFHDEDEDDEESVAKPKRVNKKQLKKEKLKQLKILEEITAKPLLKAPTKEDENNGKVNTTKSREALKTKPIVRYDPTRDEHKKFELKDEKEGKHGSFYNFSS